MPAMKATCEKLSEEALKLEQLALDAIDSLLRDADTEARSIEQPSALSVTEDSKAKLLRRGLLGDLIVSVLTRLRYHRIV
jgi:hypothetical protein